MIEDWLSSFVGPDAPRGIAARERARVLLSDLGDPQDRVRAVHVVGTAGKGTTAGLIAEALRGRGDTVGLHLSPHVHDIRERFTVADTLPQWDEVAAAAEEVAAAVRPAAPPTFFALTAALAHVLARRAGTDWLVIEAGIGGVTDATNTFGRADVVTAVTAIGLDHRDVLGETVAEIARTKIDVMAGRSVAILAPQPDPVAAGVARDAARRLGFRLESVGPTGDWRRDAEATAAAVIAELGIDAPVPPFVAQPGRFETIERTPLRWILDGAHNPMKLTTLATTLADQPRPRVGIVAIGEGKDLDGGAAAIAPALDRAVAVTFGPPEGTFGPAGHGPATVAAALERAGVATVTTEPDAATAARALMRDLNEPATVVVTGSFMHLTAVREVLQGG